MKKIVAVPYENGEVFQHFGHTSVFKIYETEDRLILSAKEVDTNGQGHGLLADFLTVMGASVVICGGIGGGAKDALAGKGIAVFGGVQGDADARVQEYLDGMLAYNPDIQCNHKHDHDHVHGENCGHHSCGSAEEQEHRNKGV